MEALGSIRLVKMTKANGKQHQEEEEDSSLEGSYDSGWELLFDIFIAWLTLSIA